jgi:hypothetical protein
MQRSVRRLLILVLSLALLIIASAALYMVGMATLENEERDQDIIVDFPADFRFDRNDTVYVAGSYESTQNFMGNPAQRRNDPAHRPEEIRHGT